jgi:replicative DNA helicase
LRNGDLIVVTGRPGKGKSAFAATITLHIAQQHPVLYVSCEMSKQRLTQRWISQLSGVNLTRLWRGPISHVDCAAAVKAAALLSQLPILPVTGERDWNALATHCQREVAMGAKMVIIDYLGLLTLSGGPKESWERIGVITKGAKALAMRLDVPIVLMAQLNREAVKGGIHRPSIHECRGSGDIEQDADVIVLIHRDDPDDATQATTAELIFGKFRNGPTGIVMVRWQKEVARFEDLDAPHAEATE